MAYIIDKSCFSCGLCVLECAPNAIREDIDQYVIDPELCTNCRACAEVCPVDAPRPKEVEFAQGLIL